MTKSAAGRRSVQGATERSSEWIAEHATNMRCRTPNGQIHSTAPSTIPPISRYGQVLAAGTMLGDDVDSAVAPSSPWQRCGSNGTTPMVISENGLCALGIPSRTIIPCGTDTSRREQKLVLAYVPTRVTGLSLGRIVHDGSSSIALLQCSWSNYGVFTAGVQSTSPSLGKAFDQSRASTTPRSPNSRPQWQQMRRFSLAYQSRLR